MNDQSNGNKAAQSSNTLGFTFSGDGMEYFKIWIVNVLLTILTLGIYSAWATVRNNRYFYSNLSLDGSNFRYLAEPLTILKGRLIAVAVFTAIEPTASMIMVVVLLLVFPYFLNQSLRFNRRMSAYKNIQFRFKGSYFEAFMVMYVWPILGMLTLGILYPLAMLKGNEYVVKNSSYGTTGFDFNATFKDYGIIFLTLVGAGLLLGLPLMWIMSSFPALNFVSYPLMAIIYFGFILFFMVQTSNLFYHSLSLAEHKFSAKITMPGLAKVMLSNMLLTILTLGLYLPAAKVRMTKYICSCLEMNANGSLDNFVADEKQSVGALGDELGQIFDFGV